LVYNLVQHLVAAAAEGLLARSTPALSGTVLSTTPLQGHLLPQTSDLVPTSMLAPVSDRTPTTAVPCDPPNTAPPPPADPQIPVSPLEPARQPTFGRLTPR